MQDASVGIVEGFLRRVDADDGLEFGGSTAFHADGNFPAGGKFLDYVANARDFENFFAIQLQCLGIFSGEKLQRQNTHAHEIGTVDALVAFGDHGADTEQARTFGRPVAR